jgi:hypothetical protein
MMIDGLKQMEYRGYIDHSSLALPGSVTIMQRPENPEEPEIAMFDEVRQIY